MPRVTAKSMAEMMPLPGYAQVRILAGQKYPRNAPSAFQVPYYSPAIASFRAAYKSGDRKAALDHAIAQAAGQKVSHKRANLERAIRAFAQSEHTRRHLNNVRVPRVESAVGTVEIKASPDLEATEDDGKQVVIYYHCGHLAFDIEAAKRLLEIAHWIYEQNQIDIAPQQFEMLDLSSGTLHKVRRIRPATIKNMKTTAKVIESLWESLE